MKGMRGRENDQISEEHLKGREGQCLYQKKTLKGERDSAYRPIDFYFKL